MAEKKLYWIGRGTYSINGKPQDKNKHIPKSKVSEVFIERNIKRKNIGEKLGTSEIISPSAEEEIKRLNKKIADLEKAGKKDLSGQVEALKKEIVFLKKTIIELKKSGGKK